MSDQFVAVPTMLRGMFRVVADPEAPRRSIGLACTGGTVFREEALVQAHQNDPLIRFLIEMDRKLDTIMGLLQRDSLEADFSDSGWIVELSGSGLVLECGKKLQTGEHLELIMTLEEFPLRLLSVTAHVEEILPVACRSGPSGNVYAITYACMRDEDREAVIRYVFSQHRKLIRQQKSGEDI